MPKKQEDQIMVFSSVTEAITMLFDKTTAINSRNPVFGGDINDASMLTLSTGEKIFLKKNTSKQSRMFHCEANGLMALAASNVIGIPKIYGIVEDKEKGESCLLMEYLNAATMNKDYWSLLGQELAKLHLAETGNLTQKKYGFFENNYIGMTVQINEPKEDWVSFFRDCRLRTQIEMADQLLDLPMKKQLHYLLEHMDQYLSEPEHASILHGDLWIGNVVCGPNGKAWLIDPAVYIGHSETDLAMTQLFGGFAPRFYEAYHAVCPIDPDYKDRKKIYQLYHLLNHVNLFGQSYLWDVADILGYLCP